MTKTILTATAAIALLFSANSCSRCYVCADKDDNRKEKFEVCDKDYSKDDIKDEIDRIEDNSRAECKPKLGVI